MEFDNSWRAVSDPGHATDYFKPAPSEPLAAVSDYRAVNAWWLAELCRLVYRGAAAVRRRALAGVGLEERRFFDRKGTQCALVAAGDRLAALVFRGTDGPLDWRTNAKTVLAPWPPGGRVHAGFRAALDDVWDELDAALDELASPVLYAGHSLGGALATLAAGRRPPLAAYTFGGPRVGDEAFAATLEGIPVYRVVNRKDAVTRSPPAAVGPLRFRHAGEPRPIALGAGAPGARRQGRPPLPGRRRWYDPPARLCDHAPVNYVACLERLARAESPA